jgi:hypothetical protein
VSLLTCGCQLWRESSEGWGLCGTATAVVKALKHMQYRYCRFWVGYRRDFPVSTFTHFGSESETCVLVVTLEQREQY